MISAKTCKALMLAFSFVLCILEINAQAKHSLLAGEYYLRGEPETASGFKLNEDSTFEFFFSYGALDRYGKGHWQVKDDSLVFNSGQSPCTTLNCWRQVEQQTRKLPLS
jgi:hypothetical protein